MKDELKAVLQELDDLKAKLDAVRPVVDKSILEAIDIEYTYDSNRIEGNTLTLRETEIVINKGLTISGKSLREHLEANNHYEAVLYVRDLVKQNTPVSERIIKDIHAIILQGIDRQNAGRYRDLPVAISGSKHKPPQPLAVPQLMEDMECWFSEEGTKLHPVLFAAEVHERIATIHPFIDGNGRTARLMMNLVLLQNGFSIADIPGDTESRLEYYNALEKCNLSGDKSDFYMLIAKYTLTGLKSLTERLGL